jgi:hypothetical protein
MPFGRGKRFGGSVNRWVNAVLGNWQTNGILTISSGRPLLFTTAENTSYSFGGGQHPDSTGVNADLGDARTINRWFDTAQFLRAAPYTFGNVGRTHPNLRQDRYENLDLSLFKTFVLKERVRAQFRAESFNTANHPIFGAPNTQFGSAQFGIIGAQGNIPRQIQFALKILW